MDQISKVSRGDTLSDAIDFRSVQGQFGWTKIMGIDMPYIFRRNERFISMHIFDTLVMRESPVNVHAAVFDYCFRRTLPTFAMTPAERRLFEEINSVHSDWGFGPKYDPRTDLIFRLVDASICSYIFAELIALCYSKGVNDLNRMVGFVRYKDNVLPYAATSTGVKLVPKFYFEDASGFVKSKKVAITGARVPYVKLCCYILGIRADLVRGKTISAVDLDSIRSCLPDEHFEDVWPDEDDLIEKLESIGPDAAASIKWIVHSSLNSSCDMPSVVQTNFGIVEVPEVDAEPFESYRLQVFPRRFNGRMLHCINMVAFKFSSNVSKYLIYLWELHRKVFKRTSMQALVHAVNQHCNLYKANKAQIELLFQEGWIDDWQKGFDLLVVAEELDASMEMLNRILQR